MFVGRNENNEVVLGLVERAGEVVVSEIDSSVFSTGSVAVSTAVEAVLVSAGFEVDGRGDVAGDAACSEIFPISLWAC